MHSEFAPIEIQRATRLHKILQPASVTGRKDRITCWVLPAELGNQSAPIRGLSGPPALKCRESPENVSKVSPPKTQKSLQKVTGDSPGSPWRVSGKCLESVWTVSGTLGKLFRVSGIGGTGRRFRDFLRTSGPSGLREPAIPT